MPLLNYTTTVSVDKTLSEIQRILASHGSRSILTDYDGQGNPIAVSFVVPTQFGERPFRLPANIEGVWKTMTQQYQKGQMPRRFATKDQATRVGWRIIRDWLAAQMAIIEAGMVSLDEVMLPYLQDAQGHTLYQVMAAKRLMLPAAKGENDG